ncbi:hypothetical protein FJY71_04750 [candidate division WOR-3 bacterium]|nr:hypothetical protein [candidate division WOR-3 bacterium]
MNMVKPSQDRLQKWDSKFDLEVMKPTFEKLKPLWRANARDRFQVMVAYEIAVKTLLNRVGVSVALLPSYLCFAREILKARRRYSGNTYSYEAYAKVQKWVARKLDENVLRTISRQVFDVDPQPMP